MINITETEKRIEDELEALLVPPSTTPPFKLRVYPGSLDDLGKPIQCNHVVVQFRELDFENKSQKNFNLCKVVQINVCRFNILVQSNNLRTHREIYQIAQDVICQLRGKKLLVQADKSLVQGQNPFRITSFTFDTDIKNGGVCYQSNIDIEASFTDTYTEEC